MNFLYFNLKAALISTISFLFLIFFYGLLIDPTIEYVLFSLLVQFIFIFPIYLLIGNPITILIRLLLKKILPFIYLPLLILIVGPIAFTIIYIMSGNNGIDAGNIPIFTLIIACSSIFGIEAAEKSR
jgi:hypothetical protein